MATTFGNVEVVTQRNGRTYTVIEVPSSSNPSKMYRVDVVNGRCSCPSWVFSRSKGLGYRPVCKHLRSLGFTD